MSFTYIASPYTHDDYLVMLDRYNKVKAFTAHLLRKNVMCFSPILHNHQMAIDHNMPKNSAFWRAHNYAILSKASRVIVLALDGHDQSVGVRDEIDFAISCNIDVEFMDFPSCP